ncbi:MAG: hypothetical protein FWF12_09040 [Betaproteobacteria bacterium]|nr:hypothetical protein [Betaproteobacteria bacterium]
MVRSFAGLSAGFVMLWVEGLADGCAPPTQADTERVSIDADNAGRRGLGACRRNPCMGQGEGA